MVSSASNERLNVKKTIAVPSLSRLSASSNVVSRRGAPILRKSATTATGSVAEIKAPNTTACFQLKPGASPSASTMGVRTAAMSTVDAITPGTASEKIVLQLSRSSLESMWKAASKIRPGKKTENSKLFVSPGAGNKCTAPSTKPARTSATVYGMRARCTTMATAAATTNSKMKAVSMSTANRRDQPFMSHAREERHDSYPASGRPISKIELSRMLPFESVGCSVEV